jgi:cytochrome c556
MILAAPVVAGEGPMNRMMQGLSENMARINEGIWREDFEAIAGAAEAIAEHPLPPLLQRLELLAQLGTDSSRFMKADKEMQGAALALKEAAGGRQVAEVVSRYQLLQQHCVECHSWYRQGRLAQDREKITGLDGI